MWGFIQVIPFNNQTYNINSCYTCIYLFTGYLTPTHQTTELMYNCLWKTHSYTLKYYEQQYLLQTTGKKAQEALYPQVTIKSMDMSPYIFISQLFFISNMLFYKQKLFHCLWCLLLNTHTLYQARSLPTDTSLPAAVAWQDKLELHLYSLLTIYDPHGSCSLQ